MKNLSPENYDEFMFDLTARLREKGLYYVINTECPNLQEDNELSNAENRKSITKGNEANDMAIEMITLVIGSSFGAYISGLTTAKEILEKLELEVKPKGNGMFILQATKWEQLRWENRETFAEFYA